MKGFREKQKKSAKDGSASGRKKVGFRTSKRFLRNFFRRNVNPSARPRSLGGHR